MLRDVCVQQEKLLQEIDAFGPGCPMPRTSVPSSPTKSRRPRDSPNGFREAMEDVEIGGYFLLKVITDDHLPFN